MLYTKKLLIHFKRSTISHSYVRVELSILLCSGLYTLNFGETDVRLGGDDVFWI